MHIRHPGPCGEPECDLIPGWARDLAFLIDDYMEQIMLNFDNLNNAADRVVAKVNDLETTQSGSADTDAANQAALDAVTAKLDAIAPAPVAAPVVAAPPAQTLYVHTDGNPFDSAQYVSAGVAADGVTQLFTFNGDLNPGDTTGANADFAVYTA